MTNSKEAPYGPEFESSHHTEIWDRVRDYGSRQRVAQLIENQFLSLGCRIGVFFGPSSVGKTTLMSQLASKLEGKERVINGRKDRIENIEIVTYDNIWKSYADAVGLNREFTLEDYQKVSQKIREALWRPLEPHTVRLVEILIVGDEEKDRGREPLSEFVQTNTDVAPIGVISKKETQEEGTNMRVKIVKEIPDENVENVLNQEYNFYIEDFSPGINPSERGGRIKATFEKMAFPEDILRLYEEMRQDIKRLTQTYSISDKMKAQIEKLANKNFEESDPRLFYFLYLTLISTFARIPARIIYNPLYKGKRYWHARMFPPLSRQLEFDL